MISKKKKIIILSVMALLLVATGVLNVILNNASGDGTTPASKTYTSSSFFSSYRTDRQSVRDQEIMYLNAIIQDKNASSESIKSAEEQRQKIINLMDIEMVCENLIKARGFDDCIVSTTTNFISVIVRSASLSQTDVGKIVSVVKDVCSVDNDSIKIIPYA